MKRCVFKCLWCLHLRVSPPHRASDLPSSSFCREVPLFLHHSSSPAPFLGPRNVRRGGDLMGVTCSFLILRRLSSKSPSASWLHLSLRTRVSGGSVVFSLNRRSPPEPKSGTTPKSPITTFFLMQKSTLYHYGPTFRELPSLPPSSHPNSATIHRKSQLEHSSHTSMRVESWRPLPKRNRYSPRNRCRTTTDRTDAWPGAEEKMG
ncbi:Uncharacterized protein Rs2_12107 [Raphanus sativus]|nr:Uncharacterized protein Rs2_12107 [Raphanus sativus]